MYVTLCNVIFLYHVTICNICKTYFNIYAIINLKLLCLLV